jgi:pyrophosphatase PpaX
MELTTEFLHSLLGPALKDIFPKYFKEDFKTLFDTYREFNFKHHPDYVTAFPTVIDTLRQLKAKGIQLGIITSKMHDAALLGTNLTQMTDYFDVIIGLDDVTYHKPHPEGILKAMHQLHALPHETIYVGDSASDLLAGRAAGILIGAVDWTPKAPHYYKDLHPQLILKEMADLVSFVTGG